MDPKDIDLKAAFDDSPDEIDPAQAEAMAQELSDARARLLEAPVADVVVNHAVGLYELAAIHLTASEPDFDETRLAIDALKALVENLGGRLGEGEEMLQQALSSLQMGFVQRLAESDDN
ncbi:MAG: hypothetical protein KJN63_08185 [Acidimicrobiia bacterium]|nr:hypothetical protein [Acidimicrobiia bacterium]